MTFAPQLTGPRAVLIAVFDSANRKSPVDYLHQWAAVNGLTLEEIFTRDFGPPGFCILKWVLFIGGASTRTYSVPNTGAHIGAATALAVARINLRSVLRSGSHEAIRRDLVDYLVEIATTACPKNWCDGRCHPSDDGEEEEGEADGTPVTLSRGKLAKRKRKRSDEPTGYTP